MGEEGHRGCAKPLILEARNGNAAKATDVSSPGDQGLQKGNVGSTFQVQKPEFLHSRVRPTQDAVTCRSGSPVPSALVCKIQVIGGT